MSIDHDTLLFFDASCVIAATGSTNGGSGFLLNCCRRGFLRVAISQPVLLEVERHVSRQLGVSGWGHHIPIATGATCGGETMAVTDRVSRASWLPEVTRELLALLDLQPDWNSYGAPSIDPRTIGYGLALLHRAVDAHAVKPAVIASPSGGFQFEWHERGIDLEVEVLPDGQYSVYFGRRDTGSEQESEGSLDEVADLVQDYVQSNLIAR